MMAEREWQVTDVLCVFPREHGSQLLDNQGLAQPEKGTPPSQGYPTRGWILCGSG